MQSDNGNVLHRNGSSNLLAYIFQVHEQCSNLANQFATRLLQNTAHYMYL